MKGFIMTIFQLLFSLSMYAMGVVFFGIALAPGVYIFLRVYNATTILPLYLRGLYLGLSIATGYFLFGFTLILLAGLVRTLFRLRLKEGNYRLNSFQALKWAFVSCLYLLINFTFIDFILLTPFANILQRMLGARLGRNVQINSKFIFDATLLEIGDNTVVGGGAIINGHTVERGVLKLRKVKIGKNVTVGSHATVMPGCEIGDRAIIGAGAVLLKNTKVKEREVWYGVPAAPIKPHRERSNEEEEK